ncbi:substrate-binding periplasmic protein [Spirochaetota bacterium]
MQKKYQIRIIMIIVFFSLPIFLNAKYFSSGEVYNKIIGRNEIRIGISKHYPPLNFNSGKKGVEMLIAKNLGKFLGVRVKLIPLNLKKYVSSIRNNNVDIIIAGLSRNLVRAKRIWFSVPYITITPGVLASKRIIPETKFSEDFEAEPIKTLWDLKRLNRFKIAVKKGSSYEYLLKIKFPSMSKVYVKTNDEGMMLLNNGKVHGFIHDSLYLQYLYRKSGKLRSRYKLLEGGKQNEKICIGLPFGDTVLKNQVDTFIDEIIRQGLINSWLEKHNR